MSTLCSRVFTAALPIFLVGCQYIGGDTTRSTSPVAVATDLSRGYALLDDLLADESRVDGLLVIKFEAERVGDLVTRIGETARAAREQLTTFAEQESFLIADSPGLPVMEQRARDRIGSVVARRLVLPGGRDDLELLLAQVRALDYAQALCAELAEEDADDQRSEFLEGRAEAFGALADEARELLDLRSDDS